MTRAHHCARIAAAQPASRPGSCAGFESVFAVWGSVRGAGANRFSGVVCMFRHDGYHVVAWFSDVHRGGGAGGGGEFEAAFF